jgi:hypothetical protein
VPGRHTLTHEEKVAPVHRGKQQRSTEDVAEAGAERRRARGTRGPTAQEPEHRTFRGRGEQPYSEAHEQVFRALAEAEREHGGEGVHLDEVARASGIPREEARVLLHDLMTVHGLVTELRETDAPDLGPRYETKPRL